MTNSATADSATDVVFDPHAARKGKVSLEEFRAYCVEKGITTKGAFVADKSRPACVPGDPAKHYQLGWAELFGRKSLAQRKDNMASFEEFRAYCDGKTITKKNTFIADIQRPAYIPSAPHVHYQMTWAELFGRKSRAQRKEEMASLEEFRAYCVENGTNTAAAFLANNDRPAYIPGDPSRYYGITWAELFCNKSRVQRKEEMASLEKFRAYCVEKGITTEKAFKADKFRPDYIPGAPAKHYQMLWSELFGKKSMAQRKEGMASLEEFHAYCVEKGINAVTAFLADKFRPDYIPGNPTKYYGITWAELFDRKSLAQRKDNMVSLEEFRAYYAKNGITTYAAFKADKLRPAYIPSAPYRHYQITRAELFGKTPHMTTSRIRDIIVELKEQRHDLHYKEKIVCMIYSGAGDRVKMGEGQLIKKLRFLSIGTDEEAENAVSEIFGGVVPDDGDDSDSPTAGGEVGGEIGDVPLPQVVGDYDPDALDEKVEEKKKPCTIRSLHTFDKLTVTLGSYFSPDAMEFLILNRVQMFWNEIMAGRESAERLRQETGEKYFTEIKDRFLSQYDAAVSMVLPEDMSWMIEGVQCKPTMMQRLIASRFVSEPWVINLSGVGTGKTRGFLLASRVLSAQVTLLVVFNGTVDGWINTIRSAVPGAEIVNKDFGVISKDKPTYIVLNYESFQTGSRNDLVEKLSNTAIDCIGLDEVQLVKQRDVKVESIRRGALERVLQDARRNNPDLRIMPMSATPVKNNLQEAKSILELASGRKFDELPVKPNLRNSFAYNAQMVIHGVREVPHYASELITTFVEIDGTSRFVDAANCNMPFASDILMAEIKMPMIVSLARRGTMIYTEYTTDIVLPMKRALESAGFSVGVYTGEDHTGKQLFLDGDVDILIGSSAIATGVDGLQNVCSRMIIVGLPWNSANYDQLIGRLRRTGQDSKTIEVVIPQVLINQPGGKEMYSWDHQRHEHIIRKKTLSDAVNDGIIPEGCEMSSVATMFTQMNAVFARWLAILDAGEWEHPERPCSPYGELPEVCEQERVARNRSHFSHLNSKWNCSNSSTTHAALVADPAEFHEYHRLFAESREKWLDIPVEYLARALKSRPDFVIGDFGCGGAYLSGLLPDNIVHSFDHVAVDESVVVCDMRSVPLPDNSLDVAVFSLSLMGCNYADYLREAFRVLKPFGWLHVVETVSRWENSSENLGDVIESCGFKVHSSREFDRFVHVMAIKERA